MADPEFTIFESKHILIEQDYIKGGQRRWMSFGIHFDWQKPHLIIYFANWVITVGETYWGRKEEKESKA